MSQAIDLYVKVRNDAFRGAVGLVVVGVVGVWGFCKFAGIDVDPMGTQEPASAKMYKQEHANPPVSELIVGLEADDPKFAVEGQCRLQFKQDNSMQTASDNCVRQSIEAYKQLGFGEDMMTNEQLDLIKYGARHLR